MSTGELLYNLVQPICIPTPFAVGDVWCYLIDDEKKILVDCGQYEDTAFSIIEQELRKVGLGLKDIDEIWLTHGHPDHFGQAARLADLSGARIYGHAKERSNFACNDDSELFEDFFREIHIPRKLVDTMTNQLDWLQQFQLGVRPGWVEEGELLESGRLSFNIAHTPGHAPGHLCFYSEEGIIFGGDVLLEKISTNALINFDPDTGERNRSLLQYRRSLRWMRDRKGIVLPGHGSFISNIKATADHHLREHEKRYQKIVRLLSAGEKTLIELARDTFPDAMKKGAAFLVLSEVLGYLDWGIEEGTISREGPAYKAVD